MKSKQRFGLSVSFSEEEQKMVETLRKSPNCINMSEFIRDCIRRLYGEKIKIKT